MNLESIESRFEPTPDGKCAVVETCTVSTAFPYATRAGVEMLKQGGNAIDTVCTKSLTVQQFCSSLFG